MIDFNDIVDFLFYGDCFLLMDDSMSKLMDFFDIVDFSFCEIENLFLDDDLCFVDDFIRN